MHRTTRNKAIVYIFYGFFGPSSRTLVILKAYPGNLHLICKYKKRKSKELKANNTPMARTTFISTTEKRGVLPPKSRQ